MTATLLKTRFAPSPTGQLHLGHARAAYEAFGFARDNGGTCLLRIEDIDHTRCKPDFTRRIYQDLDWLGLDWPLPVRVQSCHIADYAKVVCDLLRRGLAYPCTLTRGDLKAGKICGPERALTFNTVTSEDWSECSLSDFQPSRSLSESSIEIITACLTRAVKFEKPSLPFTIRLDLRAALKAVSEQSLIYRQIVTGTDSGQIAEAEYCDACPALAKWVDTQRPDPIIARRDIATSYDIAVTQDDALQNITHVVRGCDLDEQTPLHVLLQKLMGWPTPIYYHHDLILREDGEKLAKRNLDTALASLRESGQSVAEIKRLVGMI